MKKINYSNLLPILTFLLGGLFGSGAIWSWKSAQIDESRLKIEEAKASLELREKMTQLFLEITIYQSDKVKRHANYKTYKLAIDNYNSIENNLATIEKRDAQFIDFEALIPKRPKWE